MSDFCKIAGLMLNIGQSIVFLKSETNNNDHV